MRTFRHWTPRYLYARTLEKIYRRRSPGLPWLTPAANEFLETWLLPTDVGLEFGSGRSTLWFARRVGHLTSVEHNPEWHTKVRSMLADGRIGNVTYHLHPAEEESGTTGMLPAYVQTAETIPADSLDFALVDGIYRDLCALASLPQLKPGGVLALDNANLYLPCGSHSPNSRGVEHGPASEKWAQFQEHTASWRSFWTSNGVSDTAFFFRPV